MSESNEFSALINALIGSKASGVIERFSDARALAEASEPELLELGLMPRQMRILIAGIKLGRLSVRQSLEPGQQFLSAETIFRHFCPRLAGEQQEQFIGLALDAHNRLRREWLVAKGTLTNCPVHPREVFRVLVREAAASCILIHNHPSGDPEPSAEDLHLTRRLVRAGALLGISVLDHVIIGGQSFVSLAERGAL